MNSLTVTRAFAVPALALLALVAALLPIVSATPAAAQSGWAVERFEAPDGSSMSTSVARRMWGDAETVVVARADDFADALAAAPVAGLLDAPLLLTDRDELPRLVREQIEHYAPDRVIIMGGTAAVSNAVADELISWSGGSIERIAGSNRFETAVRAMAFVRANGGSADPFIVRGEGPDGRGWEDAVAVSQHAALTGAPILLSRVESAPVETLQALESDNPDDITVVGGPAAVSDAAAAQLGALGPVRRLAGDSRYTTSIAVADATLGAGADGSTLWLTSGGNWQDAMVAGIAAASRGGVLLYVNNFRWQGSPGQGWVRNHLGGLQQVNVIGDRRVLTTEIDLELIDLANPTAGWTAPAGVRINPGDDARAIVESNPAGTTFVFTAGLHRGVSVSARDGDRFTGEPGAILSGAIDLDLSGVYEDAGRHVIPGVSYNPAAAPADVEMVGGREAEAIQTSLFRGSRRLTHVGSADQVTRPDQWHFDVDNDRIFVLGDPRSASWQLAGTSVAINGNADNVTVDHLRFERYATQAKVGAVDAQAGRNWNIYNITVHQAHSAGVRTGFGARVIDSRFTHNGQIGITGGDHYIDGSQAPVKIERNHVAFNGEVGYLGAWESGGIKMTNTVDTLFAQNWSHNNRGSGIWCDLDCFNPRFYSNLAEQNTRAGLHVEETVQSVVESNVSRANGAMEIGDLGLGLWVSNSPGVEVRFNIFESNRLPISAQQNGIDPGEHGPLEIADLYVHDNDIRIDAFLPGVRVEDGITSRYSNPDLRFENNTYRLREDRTTHFWMGRHVSVQEWQSEYGNDRSGTFRSAADPAFSQPNPFVRRAYGAPVG